MSASWVQYGSLALNVSASGDTILVPVIAGKIAIWLTGSLIVAGAVSVYIKSSGGTVKWGPCAFAANGGIVWPEAQIGHFRSDPGEGLTINLGSAVQVGGSYRFTYL